MGLKGGVGAKKIAPGLRPGQRGVANKRVYGSSGAAELAAGGDSRRSGEAERQIL
jgi:hypothetical protein